MRLTAILERTEHSYIGDKLQLLLSAENQEDFAAGLVDAANELGFDYFAYGMCVKYPYSAPSYDLVSSYPKAWQESYAENDYLLIDPTVQRGLRSLTPFVWQPSLVAEAPEFWESAGSFGLRHGWAQSSLSFNGVAGMLTLARSADSLGAKELSVKTPLMVWLNQIAHQGFQQFLNPERFTMNAVKLTARELEILKWTADGKTSCEISMILAISERTVNFHLNNVMAKLSCSNKVSAAVKAVTFGLI